MYSLFFQIIALEKLLLVAGAAILVPQIQRLSYELISVTLSSIVCHWMGLRARATLSKVGLTRRLLSSRNLSGSLICHELALYDIRLLPLTPLRKRNPSQITRIVLCHAWLLR